MSTIPVSNMVILNFSSGKDINKTGVIEIGIIIKLHYRAIIIYA